MSRVDVISGIERRRRWSAEQKQAIVAASFEVGACVSEVARRYDVHPNQIYRWRRVFCGRDVGFAEVVVVPSEAGSAAMVEIEVAGKMRIGIPPTTPPMLAAAIVRALDGR